MSEPERAGLSPDDKEAWDYLLEVLGDYARYTGEIGNLGLAAPNLLYFRDDIQDGLDQFQGDSRVDFRAVWLKVKELDDVVRARAKALVDEVGHDNFKQYRIINDPPKSYWWWYLDRMVPPPPPPPPSWQFWHWKVFQNSKPEEEPAPESAAAPEKP